MANLPSTKKAALFLAKDPNIGQIISVAALYNHFKQKDVKVTVVAEAGSRGIQTLQKLLPELKIENDLPERKFVLSIRKSNANIDNVQWQQDDENLNIYISVADGTIAGNALHFDVVGADYDLAILPGVSNLEQLGDIAIKDKDFLEEVKLFSIGSELNVPANYDHSSSNRDNLTTLSEQTFVALEGEDVKPPVAQLLFAGVLLETNNLRSSIKSTELFMNLKKLADRGAKTTEVAGLATKLQVSAVDDLESEEK